MIKSVTFKENYELSLEKEEQKRWGTKTYQPTRYTREKEPWTMFILFKKGLHIEFNSGVNIIVGDNGSGKSTLFSLIKNYAGKAPDKMTRALSDMKTDEEFIKWNREHYRGELIVDGDISFKNSVFFDAEKDNPVVAIPQMINPSNMIPMAANLWDAQEESHGESMKPILEYLLREAHGGILFFDEPDTALSLKNQVWLGKEMIRSAKENGNQIIASTHALALINQFEDVLDMMTRKWVNRETYVNEMMKYEIMEKETKRYVGVISKTVRDFLDWRIEKGFDKLCPHHNMSRKFEVDNTIYICLSQPDHVRGYRLDEVIITNNARNNKQYFDILESCKPAFKKSQI